MKMIVTLLATLCFAILSAGVSAAHDYRAGALIIHHPTIKAMPPGASVASGGMSITNSGPDADRLIAVLTPAAQTIQFHDMRMEGDVMIMRQLEHGIEIPPGQTVALAPGAPAGQTMALAPDGLHLMLMGVTKPFAEGEQVPATLQFEKAGPVAVEFLVIPVSGADPMTH